MAGVAGLVAEVGALTPALSSFDRLRMSGGERGPEVGGPRVRGRMRRGLAGLWGSPPPQPSPMKGEGVGIGRGMGESEGRRQWRRVALGRGYP